MYSPEIQKKAVDLFIDLVKIDSLPFEEQKVFEYIQKYLEGKKVKMELQHYTDGDNKGSNLLVFLEGNDKTKKSMFFDSHADTVTPGKNIKPIIVDNKYIRSSGDTILGADCKTSIAVSLVAIDEVLEKNLPHGDLLFLFTSAEEIGLIGAKYIDTNILKQYDYGYILDSGGDIGSICTVAPSRGTYDINIKGVAAHAGKQANGISAIKIAGELLNLLPQGHISDKIVTNIGAISGGGTINIVPDKVEIKGEYRSNDGGETKKLLQTVDDAVAKVLSNYKNTPVQISCVHEEQMVGYVLNDNDDIVTFVHKALNKLGVTPNNITILGGTNGNIYMAKGINSVPISGGGRYFAHELKEEVIIEEYPRVVSLLLALINN